MRMMLLRVIKYKYAPKIGTYYQDRACTFQFNQASLRISQRFIVNFEKDHQSSNCGKLVINRINYQPNNPKKEESIPIFIYEYVKH